MAGTQASCYFYESNEDEKKTQRIRMGTLVFAPDPIHTNAIVNSIQVHAAWSQVQIRIESVRVPVGKDAGSTRTREPDAQVWSGAPGWSRIGLIRPNERRMK